MEENKWSTSAWLHPSFRRHLACPEKPFVKLSPACSVKLLFSYLVKGIKIKITAKFRASRRLRFEDTKRIMSPEMHPKSFGTFEKWAPEPNWGTCFSGHDTLFKVIEENNIGHTGQPMATPSVCS